MRYRLQYKFDATSAWSNWYSTTQSTCGVREGLPSGIYGRDPDGTFPNEIEANIFAQELAMALRLRPMFHTQAVPLDME